MLIQAARDDAEVELDFGGVLSVSYSFADEFVATLVQECADASVPFVIHLTGVSSEVERVVDRAIAYRQSLAMASTCADAALA